MWIYDNPPKKKHPSTNFTDICSVLGIFGGTKRSYKKKVLHKANKNTKNTAQKKTTKNTKDKKECKHPPPKKDTKTHKKDDSLEIVQPCWLLFFAFLLFLLCTKKTKNTKNTNVTRHRLEKLCIKYRRWLTTWYCCFCSFNETLPKTVQKIASVWKLWSSYLFGGKCCTESAGSACRFRS